MDAQTLRDLAPKIERALEEAGIIVEHAVASDGVNLSGWKGVPGEAILGALMRQGWKVNVKGPGPEGRPHLKIERGE